MNTKYTLIASGMPSLGILDINVMTDSEDDAKLKAGKIAKRLHLAGYYRFDLFNQAERVISFRTETAEPTLELVTTKD